MLLSDNKKFPVVSSSSFPPPPPSSSPSFYTVLEGDNLIRISIKLNISVARLKKYNHLFGKNDVIVGQVLKLTENCQITEKPFISLKESHKNSSFLEREKLKEGSKTIIKKSETLPISFDSDGNELKNQEPFLTPKSPNTINNSNNSNNNNQVQSSFRYKAISDPNLCLKLEEELHIFPRRRSLEREREKAISIGSDDDYTHYDFDLTDEERAALNEIPEIPELSVLKPNQLDKSNKINQSIQSETDQPIISPSHPTHLVHSHSNPNPNHHNHSNQILNTNNTNANNANNNINNNNNNNTNNISSSPTPNQIPKYELLRNFKRQISLPLNIDIGSISSNILTQSNILSLLRHLPLTIQNDGWKLLYSILLYGDDLSSFYQFAGGVKYTLLVVKTKDGQVFGGFGSEPWRLQRTHMFYGTGESFIFKVHNSNDSVEVFDWKYSNYFFQWSSHQQIAMGGGGGHFGFVLGSDFLHGETNPCDTYGNPHLTTHKGIFDILEVEVWGFDSYC